MATVCVLEFFWKMNQGRLEETTDDCTSPTQECRNADNGCGIRGETEPRCECTDGTTNNGHDVVYRCFGRWKCGVADISDWVWTDSDCYATDHLGNSDFCTGHCRNSQIPVVLTNDLSGEVIPIPNSLNPLHPINFKCNNNGKLGIVDPDTGLFQRALPSCPPIVSTHCDLPPIVDLNWPTCNTESTCSGQCAYPFQTIWTVEKWSPSCREGTSFGHQCSTSTSASCQTGCLQRFRQKELGEDVSTLQVTCNSDQSLTYNPVLPGVDTSTNDFDRRQVDASEYDLICAPPSCELPEVTLIAECEIDGVPFDHRNSLGKNGKAILGITGSYAG